jgi:hypothetical protein
MLTLLLFLWFGEDLRLGHFACVDVEGVKNDDPFTVAASASFALHFEQFCVGQSAVEC